MPEVTAPISSSLLGATGVVIVGHFYNRGGYASHVHGIADAIVKAGVPCRILPNGSVFDEVKREWEPMVLANASADLGPRPVLIVCDIPTRFRLVKTRGFYKRIGLTVFETDRLPTGWADACNMMDEIWVPSDFNIETFSKSGVRRDLLKKVHEAIDVDFFDPMRAAAAATKPLLPPAATGKFVFLFMFALHYRKGFDLLLRSYLQEFARHEDVFLLMSCFPIASGVQSKSGSKSVRDFVLDETFGPDTPARQAMLENAASFDIAERWLSNDDLRSLYMQSDAYFSSERAAGWNLPCMEMMALGKPVGALDWGGGTEFMFPDTAFLYRPGPLEPLDPRLQAENAWYRDHQWPSVADNDVRAAMRSMVASPTLRQERAEAGQALVHARFGARPIGEEIKRLIAYAPAGAGEPRVEHSFEVREHPLKIESYERLWDGIRSLARALAPQAISVAAPLKTVEALRMHVSACDRDLLARVYATEGHPAAGPDPFAAKPGTFGAALVLANGVLPEAVAKLRAMAGNTKLLAEADLAAFDDAVRKNAIAIPQGNPLGGRRVALFVAGGVPDAAWKFVSEIGAKAEWILTDSPREAVRSWRDLPQITIDKIVDAGCNGIIVAGPTAEEQRRLGELADMAAPHVPRVDAPVPAARRKVVDRDTLFRASIFRHWSGYKGGSLGHLTLYPAFRHRADLDREMIRLAWFVPAASGIKVSVTVEPSLLAELGQAYQAARPEFLHAGLPRDLSHVSFRTPIDVRHAADVAAGALGIWSTDGLSPADYAVIDRFDNLLLIDTNDHRMRSGFVYGYARQYFKSFADIQAARDRSRERLFAHLGEAERAYIFGTGPSLELALNETFDDGIGIVCNTIVRNDELLSRIKPKLIIAADADFHFGVSAYAGRFRDDLVRAVEKYDALFVCPEAHSGFLEHHMPSIADRVVGVPVVGLGVNLDLKRKFFCAALDNVLLQFLLPFATTIAKEVNLYGFDGKRPGEKKFWGHSAIAQYSDMLDTVENCHSAFFFYRDYQEYFDRHSRLIEQVIEQGEGLKRRYVTRTPSVVPALEQRYRSRQPLPQPILAGQEAS